MTNTTIAPGTRVQIRDEEWLIRQVDRTSSGIRIFGVVGLSPLVEGKEARFVEDIELQNGDVEIIDPKLTKAISDSSPYYRESRLLLESHFRASTQNDTSLHIGHQGTMDVLPFQLEPTRTATSSSPTAKASPASASPATQNPKTATPSAGTTSKTSKPAPPNAPSPTPPSPPAQ